MQKNIFDSEEDYQQFLEFKQFQKLKRQGKLDGVLDDADDKENQTPQSANIQKKESPIVLEEDQNLKQAFTLQVESQKSQNPVKSSNIRPAGDSSSEGNPGMLAIEPEKLRVTTKGVPEGTGGSPQKEAQSPASVDFQVCSQKEVRNQSQNDFEIEDFVEDSEYFNDINSSMMSKFHEFIECKSSESVESFAMRLSASPFHPKNQDKLVGDKSTSNEFLDDAIESIKNADDFLKNVFLVIDALSKEQKDHILEYLCSQLPESVTNSEVLRQQKIISDLKDEHTKLRDLSKLGLTHTANLEQSRQKLEFQIQQEEQSREIDYNMDTHHHQKNSNATCPNCDSQRLRNQDSWSNEQKHQARNNFSNGRAAAEQESLRSNNREAPKHFHQHKNKPSNFDNGWKEFEPSESSLSTNQKKAYPQKNIDASKVFNYNEQKPCHQNNRNQQDNWIPDLQKKPYRNYNNFDDHHKDQDHFENNVNEKSLHYDEDEDFDVIPLSRQDSPTEHHRKSKFDSSDKRSHYAPKSFKGHKNSSFGSKNGDKKVRNFGGCSKVEDTEFSDFNDTPSSNKFEEQNPDHSHTSNCLHKMKTSDVETRDLPQQSNPSACSQKSFPQIDSFQRNQSPSENVNFQEEVGKKEEYLDACDEEYVQGPMPYDQEEDNENRDLLEILRKYKSQDQIYESEQEKLQEVQEVEEEEGQCSNTYANDQRNNCQEKDDAQYIHEGAVFEREALGAHSTNMINDVEVVGDDRPKILSSNLSDDAKEWFEKLEQALKNKKFEELSELAFDAECEDGIKEEIDLDWYENKAAKMLKQASQL